MSRLMSAPDVISISQFGGDTMPTECLMVHALSVIRRPRKIWYNAYVNDRLSSESTLHIMFYEPFRRRQRAIVSDTIPLYLEGR